MRLANIGPLSVCGVLGTFVVGITVSGTTACNRAETRAAASAPAPTAKSEASAAATSASARLPAERPDPAPSAPDPAPSGPATGADRQVTIPAGTELPIVLDTTVGSDISHVEQPVSAHLAKPVTLHGHAVLPVGTRVSGIVTEATRPGKVKGRAHVAIRFDSLSPDGASDRYRIHTTAVGRTAPGTKKKDALEIGAPAAGGAIIGALIGGRKGALIGTAAGGAAGTAVVLSTRGREIHLNKGARLKLRLVEPVTVKVRDT